mgnify:CR=1 FL=1
MADEQDILLREIDEELKQENLQQIWKKYGTLIVVGTFLMVTGMAGFQGWKAHDLNTRTELGERFFAAQSLANTGKDMDAKNAFDSIAKDSPAGYQMLARFQLASLATKQGDLVSAIGAYKNLADDDAVNTVYRDLALVLGAFLELDAKSEGMGLVARADELASSSSPWRFTAKEVVALAALKNGNIKIAHARYEELSKEAAAPQGLRTRAESMLDILAE